MLVHQLHSTLLLGLITPMLLVQQCGSPDNDGDDWTQEEGDCDDTDPEVNPAALEVCDGIDNDCDGVSDELCNLDADGDGVTPTEGDCDDSNPNVSPDLREIVDALDNDCDGMVLIGPGTSVLGSDTTDPMANPDEMPEHLVTIDYSFDMDLTEVTVAAYRSCVEAGSCTEPVDYNYFVPGRESHPVNGVTWDQAVDYCRFVGKRLPSETEWGMAARGGCEYLGVPCDVSGDGQDGQDDERTYPWGFQEPDCTLANIYGCNGSTVPVGSYPAGAAPYGALDMCANVYEWVEDCYHDSYVGAPTDGSAWVTGCLSGGERIRLGGSFYGTANYCRTANRYDVLYPPTTDFQGFRCARSMN